MDGAAPATSGLGSARSANSAPPATTAATKPTATSNGAADFFLAVGSGDDDMLRWLVVDASGSEAAGTAPCPDAGPGA